jgi:hypothetical protein
VTAAQLCYVYAVLPPGAVVQEVTGLAGEAVSAKAGPGLALAVGAVPARDFAANRLEERLENPEVATQLAVEHFRVAGELFAAGPVLPARMCTLFTSPERALAGFAAAAPRLCAALDLVTGCAQWSVRVSAPRRAARRSGEASSGADYLASVAAARRQASESDTQVEAVTEQLLDGLAVFAVDRRPVAAIGATRPGNVCVGADLLIPTDLAETFLDAARVSAAGVTVDVRGPWPPFSFVPPLEPAA